MRNILRGIPRAIIAAVGATLIMSCDQDAVKPTSPTAAASATSVVSTFTSLGTLPAADSGSHHEAELGAMAIAYPDSQVVNSAATALVIRQMGSGRAATFQSRSHSSALFSNENSAPTIYAFKSGGAGGSVITAEKFGGGGEAVIRAITSGNTNAADFQSSGATARAALAVLKESGSGVAIHGEKRASNTGGAALFVINASNNTAPVVTATTNSFGRAGLFEVQNTASTAEALRVTSTGTGNTLFVTKTGAGAQTAATIQSTSFQGTGNALRVNNAGSGFAVSVNAAGSGGGLFVSTAGGPGLQVVGGAKNAVVPTSSGARTLYSEESSEVWFSDYGFGRLTNGRARIALDQTFVETVNLTNGYHVFVQSYGDAVLVVRGRSPAGFEIVRGHGEEDAEFSYRIVAKRRGFDQMRLARAPWADSVVRVSR